MVDVLAAASDLVKDTSGRTWTVVVPVEQAPTRVLNHKSWLTASQTAEWLSARSIKPLTQAGGLICRGLRSGRLECG